MPDSVASTPSRARSAGKRTGSDEVGLVVQPGPADGVVEHLQTAGDRGYGGEDAGRRRVAARAGCAGVVAVPDRHQRPGPDSRRGESAARRRRRAGRSGLRPDQGAPRSRAACRTGGGPTWAAFGYALVLLPLGIINLPSPSPAGRSPGGGGDLARRTRRGGPCVAGPTAHAVRRDRRPARRGRGRGAALRLLPASPAFLLA